MYAVVALCSAAQTASRMRGHLYTPEESPLGVASLQRPYLPEVAAAAAEPRSVVAPVGAPSIVGVSVGAGGQRDKGPSSPVDHSLILPDPVAALMGRMVIDDGEASPPARRPVGGRASGEVTS